MAHRRKNELDRRSQRKKLIHKQPFKFAFLMRPKSGTAGQQEKIKQNEDLPCFIFSWPYTIQGKLP